MRLEVQIGQLANSQNERPKGVLPSQPLTNPRNSNQVNLAEDQQFNQCNGVHTLRSERKLIIKCLCHPIPFSTTTHKHPLHLVPIHPNRRA